ncbi:DEAD/DEAH box helicase [Pseudobutyrivibrio ruminis]|uniref:SNF2-related protein n=1 Tax=Pseudobutyrivibrio ruminis TaxID=46206 RepID=UPI0004279C49|nr:DEAD/DEAH box helicase [Pseudobutyrivibrio ruminis]
MPKIETNNENNTVEISFECKPNSMLLDSMKYYGWRWNSNKDVWFNTNSSNNIHFAKVICESLGFDVHLETGTAETTNATKYDIGDRVLFKRNNKNHIGIIDTYNENDNSYNISCSSFYELGESYLNDVCKVNDSTIEEILPKNVKCQKGGCVRLISPNNEIIIGIISLYDKANKLINLDHFTINDNGTIKTEVYENISIDQILNNEKVEKARPFKIDDIVIFHSSTHYADVTGTIIHLYNYGRTATVSYRVTSYEEEYGKPEKVVCQNCQESVPIEKLRLVRRGSNPVKRNALIQKTEEEQIASNELIKNRIINKNDFFSDADKIACNDSLYRHQKAGVLLANKYDKFAFFYDTGTGKTVMSLDIISSKTKKEQARFLIIAPKAIIKTAWLDDAAEYYPDMKIMPLYKGISRSRKQEIYNRWNQFKYGGKYVDEDKQLINFAQLFLDLYDLGSIKSNEDTNIDKQMEAEAQHFIINSELFIRNPDYYINHYCINGIVMDESALLKNYDSCTAQVMRRVCRGMKYVYLLSGKPAPNNSIEYFSQMKIVDPKTFSMDYKEFLDIFCYKKYQKYFMIPKNEKTFAELVSLKSLIISKKDCLDLPDAVDVVRLIELPESIMQDYNNLYFKCMTIIKGMDDSQIYYSTNSRLSILMKLRQMASGFFILNEGGEKKEKVILDIHKSKILELNNVLDEIEDEQVIIWCQFQHEIEMIEEELSKRAYTVTAYGKTKNIEASIEAFKSGQAKFIIAHPKTLKYGVTFTNCKYTIYYSFSYSAEDYDQSHDRNYRLGQTQKCTYIYLQAADTIDEIMFAKVMHKLTDAEFFEALVKDCAAHGIDYDALKPVSDAKIKEAIKTKEGEINIFASEITKKHGIKTEHKINDIDKKDYYTTIDYLDQIDEPSYWELNNIEKKLSTQKSGIDYIDSLNESLFDISRPDYFDFIHPNEDICSFDIDMNYFDYLHLLTDTIEENRWKYKMFRDLTLALREVSPAQREIVIKKYGLKGGKTMSLSSIASYLRNKNEFEKEYTWSGAHVSEELDEALAIIKKHFDSKSGRYIKNLMTRYEFQKKYLIKYYESVGRLREDWARVL